MKVATRRHAVREAPSRDSSSRSTRYSPAGCGASRPGSANAELKRTTVCVVRVATCGFLRKHAHAPFRLDCSRTAETMSGAASTSVVSTGIISGFERSEMPRRERRNAFTVENSEADGEASLSRKPPRPNQRILYMRPNCAANKTAMAFYFHWLNKNPNTEVEKIGRNSPHPMRYFTRLAIIEADNFPDLTNNFGSPIYRGVSSL